MSFNLQTYIVHCKSLVPRKTFMKSQLTREGFTNVDFYEDYDGDELTESIIKKYYDDSFEKQYNKYKMWFPREVPRLLKKSDISVTIKYIEIYKKIAERKENWALILEDDSIIQTGFKESYHSLIHQTPEDWDMIFLGSGCNLKSENMTADIGVYPKSHPATRCVSATLVKKQTCIDLLETIVPFHLCIDWELNYQLYLHNHKVFWWEPPLIKQGSETGLFSTSMR